MSVAAKVILHAFNKNYTSLTQKISHQRFLFSTFRLKRDNAINCISKSNVYVFDLKLDILEMFSKCSIIKLILLQSMDNNSVSHFIKEFANINKWTKFNVNIYYSILFLGKLSTNKIEN